MRVIFLLVFILTLIRIEAQEPYQIIKFDTVHFKQGYILTINNHSYISSKDTLLLIPSTVIYKIQKKRGQGFYEKLDSSAQYSRLTREIRNMILTRNRPGISVEKGSALNSEIAFLPYKDKIIRHITFKQLNVFGSSIEDTTLTESTWIERTGNNLHTNTKKSLLRNNLLFKEGDFIDPLKLADNERLLRAATYIHDAKIYIQDNSFNPDSVDVIIVVKDVWSKAFDVKVNNLHGGKFSIWDRNILGLGHENQNNIYWNSKENKTLGYEGLYSLPNIGGSFIKGRAQYLDRFGTKTYGISFDRNFYTPNTKYAGGLSYFKTNKPDIFVYPDTSIIYPVEFTKSDFWFGRSVPFNNSDLNSRKNLTFILRATNTNIIKRPVLSEYEFYNYHNRTLYLASLTITNQKFFKSNLIYNFGRTEDIPFGLQYGITGGFETNEFKSRSFLGTNFSWANYNEKIGYIYFGIGHEGFINAEKKLEQGIIYFKFNHFTPLLKYKKFRFRHFVNLDFTKGINRYKDEFLTLNEEYGLNGFINDSLKGNERFNMKFETVCFSPWYFYEFRFVFFASAELSLFGKNKNIWENPLYSGLSLGIRIRNERLVFNTIELRFHVYPFKGQYSNTELISLSGEQYLSPPNFITKQPGTSTFR